FQASTRGAQAPLFFLPVPCRMDACPALIHCVAMGRPLSSAGIDRAICVFDRALRTLAGVHRAGRDFPAAGMAEGVLDAESRAEAAALMRVNHVGEVCAQALYQGQALTARDPR